MTQASYAVCCFLIFFHCVAKESYHELHRLVAEIGACEKANKKAKQNSGHARNQTKVSKATSW